MENQRNEADAQRLERIYRWSLQHGGALRIDPEDTAWLLAQAAQVKELRAALVELLSGQTRRISCYDEEGVPGLKCEECCAWTLGEWEDGAQGSQFEIDHNPGCSMGRVAAALCRVLERKE